MYFEFPRSKVPLCFSHSHLPGPHLPSHTNVAPSVCCKSSKCLLNDYSKWKSKALGMAPGGLPCRCITRQLINGSSLFLCRRNLQHLQRRKSSSGSLEKMKMFIPDLCLEQICYFPGYVSETQLGNSKLEKKS